MKYITLPCGYLLIWPGSLLHISPGILYTVVKLVHVSHTICASCLCTIHATASAWNTCSCFRIQLSGLLLKWSRTCLGSCYHSARYISLRLPFVVGQQSPVHICSYLSLLACQLNSYRIDATQRKYKRNAGSSQAIRRCVESSQPGGFIKNWQINLNPTFLSDIPQGIDRFQKGFEVAT